MMKFLFITHLLFSLSAHADWKVADIKLDVVPCPEKNCLISKKCLNQKGTQCLAMAAQKNRVKSKPGAGGTNPGSQVCQQVHQAQVNLALDEQGNTVAFCHFKDDSFISLDGLWVW